jgi:branched-chain amino acid transport system ATP-binding protein
VAPSSGSFYIGGKERDWPKTHDLTTLGISRTLQGVGLFGDLTVLENILIGATHLSKNNIFKSLLGLDGAADEKARLKAEEVLTELDILEYSSRRADSLPYPISKRVALARALISEPMALILDEPAGGLGTSDIEWLKEFILGIRGKSSVLLVEHHMDVIMNVCDRIYVLNFGELIAEGTPTEIKNNVEVVAAYLGNEADA